MVSDSIGLRPPFTFTLFFRLMVAGLPLPRICRLDVHKSVDGAELRGPLLGVPSTSRPDKARRLGYKAKQRVPTVVSNYQKEDSDEGYGRNCLRSCFLPGAKLPLCAFKKESSNVVVEKNSVAIDEKKELQPDFLDPRN
ncbi:hypothetical protein SASPL_152679 [Salvia splendens]|uniref:Uncharacterized protein n=1 Tax=Salvia splendens TaxID=180675 RepID=A0A8X8W3H0_SALSN|nr:hypothetical protein SASPL_152679 [Salvia splendens]